MLVSPTGLGFRRYVGKLVCTVEGLQFLEDLGFKVSG